MSGSKPERSVTIEISSFDAWVPEEVTIDSTLLGNIEHVEGVNLVEQKGRRQLTVHVARSADAQAVARRVFREVAEADGGYRNGRATYSLEGNVTGDPLERRQSGLTALR